MNPLPPLLLGAAALAAVLVLEIEAGGGPPLPDGRHAAPLVLAPAATKPDADSAAPDSDALDGAVATILARPLLEPSRRPPAAAAEAAQGPRPADVLPRLAGVIVTPSERRAIFAPPSGRPIVVAEGGRLAGFVLEKIGPDAVTLSGAGGRQVIRPSHVTTQAHP